MYVTDAAQNNTDVEALRDAMSDSKGMGNFKNLFFYAPNGKPDGIKIVPLSEVAKKMISLTSKRSAPPTCLTPTASPINRWAVSRRTSGQWVTW
jgi:hypothetical protein